MKIKLIGKRILVLILTLSVILSLFPQHVLADESISDVIVSETSSDYEPSSEEVLSFAEPESDYTGYESEPAVEESAEEADSLESGQADAANDESVITQSDNNSEQTDGTVAETGEEQTETESQDETTTTGTKTTETTATEAATSESTTTETMTPEAATESETITAESETTTEAETSTEETTTEAETTTAETTTAEETETTTEAESEKAAAAAVLVKTITTTDRSRYRITVAYDESAGIPADAELKVNEVTSQDVNVSDEDILNYIDQAADALNIKREEVGFVRLFDISIIGRDGSEYQPNEKVAVLIELMTNAETEMEDIHIVHYGEEAEEIRADVENNSVSFETDGFSVFSLVDVTVLQQAVQAVLGGSRSSTIYENDDIILTGKMPVFGSVEANPVTVSIEGEEVLVAYDIKIYANSIFKALGIAWQPTDGAISVTVKSDVLAGEGRQLKVYHMHDANSEPEFVASVNAFDSSVTFDASGFSIYPIVDDGDDTDNARIGYRFWYYNASSESYQQIGTQYFRFKDVNEQGSVIYEPSIPGMSQSEFVQIFEGWHKGTIHDDGATLTDPAVTIAELNQELQAKNQSEYIEGTIIDVIAKLKSAYYITYVDVNANNILGTDLVVKEESGDTYFTIKDGMKPTRFEEDLKGWRRLEEITDSSALLYETGYSYEITENITLAPVIEGGYWLVFDDNDLVDDGTGKMVSGGASYTAPAFYMNNASEQDPTIEPDAPEWTGYEFVGWFEDEECHTPFTFGGYLTANTTVFAKWIPSNSSYTVIIWKQPTDPNATDYDFDQSFLIDEGVKTGELVYLNNSYTKIYGEDGTSTDTNKQYFTYNQEKTDQYIVVKANGSSVMNVYYDRVPMTINFYTWGNGYVYTETTADDGDQYGLVNGSYVRIYHIDTEEDVYSYTYSPDYNVAPEGLSTNYSQYGIIDGAYQPLDREPSYSYSYNAYNPTTSNNGTQYALVDGEYVRLERVAHETETTREVTIYKLTDTLTAGGNYLIVNQNSTGSGYALRRGNNNNVGRYGVTINAANSNNVDADNLWISEANATSNTNMIWTVSSSGNNYIFRTGNYYLRRNNGNLDISNNNSDNLWSWNAANNRLSIYRSSNGRTYYLRHNNGFSLSENANSIYIYEEVTANETITDYTYTWQYTDSDGNIVVLSDDDIRYTQAGTTTAYDGIRNTRNGSNWWDYQYEETDVQATGLFGIDGRGGHVQLIRSSTPDSYSYYYNGEEYTGIRYYAPNNNPVSYSGTIYTLDNGVYHVTTEGATEGRYGVDDNDVFRPLIGMVSHPQQWTYIDDNGDTQYYTGTRYTRSDNMANSWQLYRSFEGVYGATLEQYGYEWPMEYNWYEQGGRIADGGNTDTYTGTNIWGQTVTYNAQSGGTYGSRMTIKTTFEPLEGELDVKFYGGTPTTSGSTITFWKQNLNGDYELADTIYLGGNSGTFHINDKYTGYHAVSYSTNGGTSWTNVTPKGPDGYYGSAISYNTNGLRIRFALTEYDLVFFPDPSSNAEPVTYHVPYGASLSSYAGQDPGQKEGYYFMGWYADDAHSSQFDFSGTMPDHNLSVYGYWRMERIRVVVVPGADNVYMGSQALTFRLDYDERIAGALFESATRTGYTLEGWYTDPEFTNKFLFSTPVNANVEGVDMTYHTAAKWASARVTYGDDDEEHANVRGIITLYAKWIVNTSEKGVNVEYDAGEAGIYDTNHTLTTTVPIDPRLYQEGSAVVVGPAPSGYNDLYIFEYWQAIDSEGNVLTVTDNNGNQITQLYPGTAFYVDNVEPYSTINDENDEVVIKTIRLRAKYIRSEEAAARYTTITYDGNTFTDSIYPDGSQVLRGRAKDGTQRVTVTLDKEINETIVLPSEEDFYLDGYTLVGWSFIEGPYTDQINTELLGGNINFTPDQMVAADKLSQNDLNDETNTLYAMWQPKTYSVTVKQVVEEGVPDTSFTYNYKYGVENVLGNAPQQSVTLNDDASEIWEDQFEYYTRVGHVFHIDTPVIAESKDYAVRVNAIVIRDDGTREALDLTDDGNYPILGDVEITYTYSLKVPVKLEKQSMVDHRALTGAKFVLTPVAYNSDTQHWEQVGTTTFEYDMSSLSTMTYRLQEGTYRVTETQAPTNYAMMGEPLLLTVRRNEAFTLRTETGAAVDADIAAITGSSLNVLSIYDRPIRTVRLNKTVYGDDFETNGYIFEIQLALKGSPLRNYDVIGNGIASDRTNSNGVIELRIKNGEYKDLRIPYGTDITITEHEYLQYTVETSGVGAEDSITTDDVRIFTFTVDSDATVTYNNIKKIPAPTGIFTDKKPFDWMLIIGGVLALLALLPVCRRRRRDDDDPGGGRSRSGTGKPMQAKGPPGDVPVKPPDIKGRARPRGDTDQENTSGINRFFSWMRWRITLWRGSGPGKQKLQC